MLRYFWKIIKTGSPYSDNIILTAEKAKKMGETLIEMATEPVIKPEWVKKKETEKEEK